MKSLVPSLPAEPWTVHECRSIIPVVYALHIQRHCDILSCLTSTERCVGSVAAAVRLGDPVVSKALAEFYRCGMVERAEVEKFVFYRKAMSMRAGNENGMMHVEVDALGGEHFRLDVCVRVPFAQFS